MFKRLKRLLNAEKEVEELKKQISGLKAKNDMLSTEKYAMADKYVDKYKEYQNTIAKLNDKIEDLEKERDILYEHFDLNEEPSQEIKTKVRIDKRVHELEVENAELKARVHYADILSLGMTFERQRIYLQQSAMNNYRLYP